MELPVPYNLTDRQKDVLRWIVSRVRSDELPEEFFVVWQMTGGGPHVAGYSGEDPVPEITRGTLDALTYEDMLHCETKARATRSGSVHELGRRCTVTGRAYEAVDSDFAAPDMSFVRHLKPLAEISGLDDEIKRRCLPSLGAGSADPAMWDSAMRNCGVILEERVRDVGGITDKQLIGRDLVNGVFGKKGTLAASFDGDSERRGYRDLYAGVVGVFRNPSAHHFIDPSPEDGGAFIVFVNLLLRKLEDLR